MEFAGCQDFSCIIAKLHIARLAILHQDRNRTLGSDIGIHDRHGCLNSLFESGIGKDSRLRALHIIDQDIIVAHINLGIIHFVGIIPDQVTVILRIKSAVPTIFQKIVLKIHIVCLCGIHAFICLLDIKVTILAQIKDKHTQNNRNNTKEEDHNLLPMSRIYVLMILQEFGSRRAQIFDAMFLFFC